MLSNHEKKNRPEGFTLVELLVVIAIIGLLMAMVMPAIAIVRATVWRTTCMNNEKNLAEAIIAYHTAKQHLPYWSRQRKSINYSWCAQILEHLGDNKTAELYENGTLGNDTIPPSVFKCRAGDVKLYGLSYALNCGNSTTKGVAKGPNGKATSRPSADVIGAGLFFQFQTNADGSASVDNYKSSLTNARDGVSNTIMLVESLSRVKNPEKPNDPPIENLTQNWQNSGGLVQRVGILWNNGLTGQTNPSKYQPHNYYFPSGNHANTDNYAFAGGGVKSVSKRIHYMTFACLMAPSDADCSPPLVWPLDASYE